MSCKAISMWLSNKKIREKPIHHYPSFKRVVCAVLIKKNATPTQIKEKLNLNCSDVTQSCPPRQKITPPVASPLTGIWSTT